ncbi:uncharacterized protein HKW66_Vig0019570 [Vigna angularis]|uniref:Uncharacterized protein n=1 Tax=Phaseolus angularis TaxID=3914 RepID=A0A8T0LAS8_PHAAN|nr:uncharacterized protein HKW66_Vig0019570 [Vigna angularis]
MRHDGSKKKGMMFSKSLCDKECRERMDGGIRHYDNYRDSGASNDTKHVRVSVEQFDAIDGGLRFEEDDHQVFYA